MSDATQIDFGTREFLRDPYTSYRRLQENAPVYWMSFRSGMGGMWLVSRYDDVMALLKDSRISKDFSLVASEEELTPIDRSMLFRDPPDHTRLRGLVNMAFTPRRIEQLKPRILALIDGFLDDMAQKGKVDFVAELAFPLPVAVIAEMLGVPREDGERFNAWSRAFIQGTDGARVTPESAEASMRAGLALDGYLSELIEQRRRHPQEDLISALIRARDGGESLSDTELLGTCVLLLIAGHETTVNLLGNGLLTLLRHPQQMALLRDRPDLIDSAVEEMLRYESPVQRGTGRFTTASLEIAGQKIEAGQQVSALFGAANRDATRFPEPDRFDIRRKSNRHLAFGFGIHFCLGAPLARAEATLAFPRLLHRFERMKLMDKEPEWQENTFMRGLRRLRVEIGA